MRPGEIRQEANPAKYLAKVAGFNSERNRIE